MAITEHELEQAEARMAETRAAGHAVSARYDRRRSRVAVALDTGVELTFPTRLAEGLADASPDSLAEIEISPAELGLHRPQLDADLYVPALLQGVFGSKTWMARQNSARKAGAPARPPKSPHRAPMVRKVAARARSHRPDRNGSVCHTAYPFGCRDEGRRCRAGDDWAVVRRRRATAFTPKSWLASASHGLA